MKKILFAIALSTVTLQITSCSDDFEVSAPYKNVAFVYGLLNMHDTAHYIRIQKAFLDENKNAVDMAQISDSSFFKDLDVVVREINGTTIVNNFPLQKVDLAHEGFVKEDGSFFTSPNYAYKFKDSLNPAYRYRLVITNNADATVDSSEIDIIDVETVRVPAVNDKYVFNFSRTANDNNLSLFYMIPNTARYLEAKILFRWMDKNTVTGAETYHTAEYLFNQKPVPESNTALVTPVKEIYSYLNEAMKDPPANVERYMGDCDLKVLLAGKDFFDYFNIVRTQFSGLTADQLKPLYSNIYGEDVYGVFSTRAIKVFPDIALTDETIDSFMMNPITKPLNIKGKY